MTIRVALTHNSEDREAYFGRALTALTNHPEVTVVTNPHQRDLTTDELIDLASGAEVVIAHRSTPGDAQLFRSCPELMAFLRTAVDISTVDVDAATTAGVWVGHADKSFVPSTAELALGLLIDAVRNLSASRIDYRSGLIPPQRPGRQLAGMTAGIIGFGAIGSYLADLLHGVGLTVVVHDPKVVAPAPYQNASLPELLNRADVVIPLVPAAADTHHLINADTLALMRPHTIVVNVSRGEVVDEDAVLDALDRGHLAAFACDVGSAADQRPNPALAVRDDVIATPHLGGLTPENADAQAMSAVEQVLAMIDGHEPPRLANPSARSRFDLWRSRQ